MNYPSTIPAVRAAILAYSPTVAVEGYDEALSSPSIVTQAVGVFNALSPHVDELDADGLALLAGCARLIGQHSWHGKAGEAFEVFARVSPMLPAVRVSADPGTQPST